MSCSHMPTCPLYPYFRSQALLNVWKQYYCENAFAECERFRRSTRGEAVPLTLLPNGKTLVLPPP